MIFYFSGTGNSLHAAEEIAKAQGEVPVSIAAELDKGTLEYNLNVNALIGFVFPIYAWGPPEIVLNFIKKIEIHCEKPYVFSVSTCGANEGTATNVLQKALSTKGLKLNSAFSVVMPGNYIIGEDVTPADEQEKILNYAEGQIKAICEVVTKRQNVFHLIPGDKPSLHTGIINPLFNRFARGTKSFYALDTCTKCGLCEKICPVHIIEVKEKPVWSNGCTQCLACINRCPVKAIQYGKRTLDRGRYVYPNK